MNKSTLRKQTNSIRILNYISTLFAVILIITQYLPFWGCFQCSTCGDGRVLSIGEYVWFANNHSDGLTAILSNYYIPGFKAMDAAGTTALIQIAGVLSIVFCILRPTMCSTALLPLISGLSCVLGYLSPAYQLGQNWHLHWGIGIATVLCAIATFIAAFCLAYKKTKAEVLAELISE